MGTLHCVPTQPSPNQKGKNLLILSSMRSLLGITRDDEKCKLQIIKLTSHKGALSFDMKMSKYSCKSLIRCWTIVPFFYILDTIHCNA